MQRTYTAPGNAQTSPANKPAWLQTIERWLPACITVALIVGTTRSLLEAFYSGKPWMVYETDDFFYYLKIAQNIAHGAGSTFNGIVPTNGYHPLWLLLLTAFSFFTTDTRAIFIFISAWSLIATVATYLLCRTLILRSGGEKILASALAAYVAIYSLHIFTIAMEVTLTVPLAFAVLVVAQTRWWQRGLLQSACLGLLVSAMILSRLDTLMMAGLMFLAMLAHPGTRRSLRPVHFYGLALGLLPVLLYFLSNQLWFHSWLPVSGMAKQMKLNHLPSNRAWESLYGKKKSQLLSVLPIVLAIGLLPFIYKRLTAMQQVLYPIALLFPFFFIMVLSCLSDWELLAWYFYPFRFALGISLAIFCVWAPTAAVMRSQIVGCIAALAIFFVIFSTHSLTSSQRLLYEIGCDVRDFAVTHPGTYAMGDRAGMVGYLLPEPLVQTEGLVMDRGFLQNIRQQVPLRDALSKYGVRYYVATDYPPYTKCFHAVEPYQAGPASPVMVSDFCQQPVAVFPQEGVRTLIFDLSAPPAVPGP